MSLHEGPGKPAVAAPHGPHPGTTPKLQELKMQVGLWAIALMPDWP